MEGFAAVILDLGGVLPYFLVLGILLACGLGLPVPEDITLVVAGLAAYYGSAHIGVMIAVCFVGVLLGDSFAYMLGKRYGLSIAQHRFLARIFSPERIDGVESLFHSKGNRILFVARFMPGLRALVFFTAGTVRVPYRVFILYDGMAALLSVPAVVFGAYYFGDEFDYFLRVVRSVGHGALAIGLLIIGAAVFRWSLSRRRRCTALAAGALAGPERSAR